MRNSSVVRSTLLALSVSLSSFALAGCGRGCGGGADVTAETIGDEAVTETTDTATTSLVIEPDGKVRASVRPPNGAAADKSAQGQVTARPLPSGAPVTAKLQPDPKSGLLTAQLPKLDAELTEVTYDVTVGGKPSHGVLHLPKGGTSELVDAAKHASNKHAGHKGPNGGVVQVVGGELVEIVADARTGEVRVYVLDDDLKPVPVGKRHVRLATVANAPELVELTPDPSGAFFTGKLSSRANPHLLTVVFKKDENAKPTVVLVGLSPGKALAVGHGAPGNPVFVQTGFAPPGQAKDKDTPPGQAKDKDKDTPPGQAKDNPPGQGKDNPPGQGKDNPPGQGKGNDKGGGKGPKK